MTKHVINFNGFDLETSSGYPVIAADRYEYRVVKTFSDIMRFLFRRQEKRRHNQYYTFNLSYDRDSILKLVPRSLLEKYFRDQRAYDESPEESESVVIKYGEYEISLFGNKAVSIKKGREVVRLIDISQFFATEKERSLDALSEKYLGEKKMSNSVIKNLISHQTEFRLSFGERSKLKEWNVRKYIIRNSKMIGEYCQKDAELTARLAELVIKTAQEKLHISRTTLFSSAGLGEAMTIKHCGGINGYPKKVHEPSWIYAKMAYHGGLFLTLKRGSFGKTTELDIDSAYPSVQVELDHWGNGRFFRIEEENEILPSDIYGWFFAEYDCPWLPYRTNELEDIEDMVYEVEDEFSEDNPKLKAKVKTKKVYYPSGRRYGFITLVEYRFMKKWGYQCEIFSGYVWRQDRDKYIKPFGWMYEVHQEKEKLKLEGKKGTMEYLLLKISLNGSYGKTAQRRGKPKLQNWYYASYITSTTLVTLVDFILSNNLKDRVINFATDGLLIEGELSIELPKGLGGWDKEMWDSCLILGNGMYQLKRTDENKTAMRGITNNRNYDITHELQKIRMRKSCYPKILRKGRPVHLSEAIQHHKVFSPKDINCWKKICRKLDPGTDDKRRWSEEYISFDQLLSSNMNSIPVQIEDIQRKK